MEKISPVYRSNFGLYDTRGKAMEKWSDDYECEGQMTFAEYLQKELVKNGNDNRRNSEKVSESGNSQRKERTDTDFS